MLTVAWLVKIISVLNWPVLIAKANAASALFATLPLCLLFLDAPIARTVLKLALILARKDKRSALPALLNVDCN